MISDDPEKLLFHQIDLLVEELIQITETSIDQLIFYQSGALYKSRRKFIDLEIDNLSDFLFEAIKTKYNLIAISLNAKNTEFLFTKLKLIEKLTEVAPHTIISIFLAPSLTQSILNKSIEYGVRVYSYPRHGVSKTSKKWKTHLMNLTKISES